LEEAKTLKVDAGTDLDVNLWKDLFCASLSSRKIESCLWECMKRALYNGQRITEETFEPNEARVDYLEVSYEVAKHNVTPFLSGLSARFAPLLAKIKSNPA
jgi:hypothetical protein